MSIWVGKKNKFGNKIRINKPTVLSSYWLCLSGNIIRAEMHTTHTNTQSSNAYFVCSACGWRIFDILWRSIQSVSQRSTFALNSDHCYPWVPTSHQSNLNLRFSSQFRKSFRASETLGAHFTETSQCQKEQTFAEQCFDNFFLQNWWNDQRFIDSSPSTAERFDCDDVENSYASLMNSWKTRLGEKIGFQEKQTTCLIGQELFFRATTAVLGEKVKTQ